MAGLPILKLAGLMVKTISKPLANSMKSYTSAGKHPNFSKCCIWIGESAHQIVSRLNVYASGYKFLGVKPLPREDALKQGIDIFSETMVFSFAGGVMILEYHRSEHDKAVKAEKAAIKEAADHSRIEGKFAAIEKSMSSLQLSLENIEKKVHANSAAAQGGKSLDQKTIQERRWFEFFFR